jgi:hypothetical protein
MFRRLLRAAGAFLLLFHAWLLAADLWTGQLLEPGRLLQWLLAAGLLGALYLLQREGASLFLSRRGVAIWMLAALLHGPAVAERMGATELPAIPPVTLTIAQGLGSILLGLGLLGVARTARARFVPPSLTSFVLIEATSTGQTCLGAFPPLSSRPPPRT